MLSDERRDVLEHIRMSYNDMSKSQKKVAKFLLTSGIDVVYLSASRIGELVDVNRSTVVRTAQALGYDDRYVLYSSDLTDYSNMYLVEVGDFETLPLPTDDTPARPDLLPGKA